MLAGLQSIHNKQAAADQILDMVLHGKVCTLEGEEVHVEADSICVHGDNYEAVELVKEIRRSLTEKGVELKALR